jgi:CHAT domain-containing protein/Tfp pilus assembly protein PilF
VLRIAVRAGEYLHVVTDQQTRDVVLTVSDPSGRQLLQVDSLTAPSSSPPWPPEEVHWVTDAPGEIRIALTPTGFRGPCGLRLAERRRATAKDRRRALAEAELARGQALSWTGQPAPCRAGVALFESAQRRFAELSLPRRRAQALLRLGGLQLSCLHDDAAALQAFTRAEPLVAADPPFDSIVRQHLGELRDRLHDLDGAIREYRRALKLRRRLGDRKGEALTSSTLGLALHLRGRYDEAAALFDRALALRKPGEDPGKQAQTLLNRGQLHRDLGEMDQARKRFEEALRLYRRAKDRDGEAAALNALGLLELDAERPGAALKPFQAALALRRPGTRDQAVTRTSLGVAYRQLGRLEDARRAYADALPIFRSLGDSRAQAQCLGNLGLLEVSTGHDSAALDDLNQALSLFRTLADPPDVAWSLEGKAQVLRRRGDLEGARRLMEQALAAIERHRFSQTSDVTRAEFFSTQQDSYGFLIDLLMDMRRQPEALETSERALARSLLDELDRVRAGPRSGGRRYAALTQPRPWSAAEIRRKLLDRDTLLLEYRLGEKRSFLWAVTPDSLQAFALPGRAAIEKVARPACELPARGSNPIAEESAGIKLATLSPILLGPVAPLLPGKRLVVVGDGILQSLPFAALPEPGGGEPLVARHEIVSLPSVSVLGELRQEIAARPPAPKLLWVLANPELAGAGEPLPYAGEEAAAILALAPASERFAVQGREATRAAVLSGALRNYRFLHFATHGSFAASDPDGGRLVLAQIDPRGRREANGFLRLADIYNLNLRADLVVLSACQSALGREVRGEGMMGMTRGFFYAGAERVLVSLWNVDDRAAAELMRRFYRGMLVRHLSPAAALRAAQDEIRHQARWRSPYYWAGFTLQGEWR